MGTYRLSAGTSNAVVDAITARVNGGTIKVYSGTAPATPDDAVTGTLLATFTLGSPAFGSASSRSASLNAVASTTWVANGTAGWFRAANSSGTAQFDGDAATAGEELNLSSVTATTGGAVSLTSGTMTGPA